MYTDINFPTKKALKEAVANPDIMVTVFQPGPFAGGTPRDGEVSLEGPHYPKPHKWYAHATLENGVVTKVV